MDDVAMGYDLCSFDASMIVYGISLEDNDALRIKAIYHCISWSPKDIYLNL
jgi:hypothetical protein